MSSRKAFFSAERLKRVPIWRQPAWPALTWRAAELQDDLAKADAAKLRVIAALQTLGFALGPGMSQALWSQDALATSFIEGQSLDQAAVRSSVGMRLGFAASARNDQDAEGLVRVMEDATRRAQQPMSAERLCQWQALLFPGNATRPAKLQIELGRFRTHAEPMQIISGPVGRELVHYTAPPSAQVPRDVAQLLAWLNATAADASINPLVRAAVVHLWFETIHPFEDGNGRMGRALADYVIAQSTGVTEPVFSLSYQIQQERKAYYAQLEAAQHASPIADATGRTGLDVTDWARWFVNVFRRGCEHSLAMIQHTQAAAAFWQRAAPHGIHARQHKALQLLLAAQQPGAQAAVLSADKYMQLTGASKATATRDLSQLLTAGLVHVQGQGKATRYGLEGFGSHTSK